ncbi:phage tail tape measure protein [Clostridium senegalense]
MLDAIPGVLNLAAAGGTELATTSDIVTDGLTALGLTAKDTNKFVDIMGATVTNSNTSVELMGETMKYIGSMGGALGVSMEDLSLATGLMANASVKGSMAGTALRGGLTRLIKPTKEVQLALDEYGISLQKTESGSLDLNGTIGVLRNRLSGLDDVTKSTALAQIFGQEAVAGWAAVINASESDFNKLSNAIANSSGNAEEIANTKLDSLTGQWTILQSAVEGMKIELGERLAPYAKEFVTWFTAKIPDITTGIMKIVDKTFELAHKFNELSPTAKKTIAVLAGGTLVIGPLTKGINTLVTGLSGFVKVGKGVGTTLGIFKTTGAVASNVTKVATATNIASKAMGGLGLSAKASAFLLNPWTIGIAAAGVGAYKLYKHLSKDALPAIEEFGEGLSKSTAEGMNAYRKLDVDLGASLMNIKIKSEKITEETATAITGKFAEMGNTIHQTISQKYSDTYKTMEEFFAMSGVFTDEKSNEILNRVNEKQAFEEEILQQGLQRINEIYRNAAAEHREITSQEQIEVNNIRQNMMNQMVENISQTSAEQQKILGQLAYETTALTAEQAAKVVEDSKKAMDEAINAATEQADKVIESARYQRDVLGTLKPEEAQTIISAAESQKEYAINAAQGMHEEVVMHAQEQAQDHVHEVDWETGQVRDKFDAMMEKIREFIAMDIPEKKIVIKEVFERVTNNINESYKQNHNSPGPSPAQVISAGPKFRGGKANGIGNTSPGNYEVAEKGFEIVVGKQTRLFKGGERILNNKESRKFLQQDLSFSETQENTEKPKMNFSVAKPQLIVAGGNNSVNVEVENNFESNADIDSIVKEATTQFAYKLKQALVNIKK